MLNTAVHLFCLKFTCFSIFKHFCFEYNKTKFDKHIMLCLWHDVFVEYIWRTASARKSFSFWLYFNNINSDLLQATPNLTFLICICCFLHFCTLDITWTYFLIYKSRYVTKPNRTASVYKLKYLGDVNSTGLTRQRYSSQFYLQEYGFY